MSEQEQPAGGGNQYSLSFSEEMRGHVALGETDPKEGFQLGVAQGTALQLHADVEVTDIDRFIEDPMHEAPFGGYVDCEALGGRRPAERGIFNLFSGTDDPRHKQLLYRVYFHDAQGQALTFSGHKEVVDESGPPLGLLKELWPDNTTLFSRVLRGHVGPAEEAAAEVLAAGVIHLSPSDFLRQLMSFRVHGPSPAGSAAALLRFGRLFFGQLWDVYVKQIKAPRP